MISVCTCSHSFEVHGVCGAGQCSVCECHCFRGAKRMPRSCRYKLRGEQHELREIFYETARVRDSAMLRDLFTEEKAS